jgi:hypothetical protein
VNSVVITTTAAISIETSTGARNTIATIRAGWGMESDRDGWRRRTGVEPGRSATTASSSPYVRAVNTASRRSSSSSADSRPSPVAWRNRSEICSRSASDALRVARLAISLLLLIAGW